jgi:hypothetical protein
MTVLRGTTQRLAVLSVLDNLPDGVLKGPARAIVDFDVEGGLGHVIAPLGD